MNQDMVSRNLLDDGGASFCANRGNQLVVIGNR
jgi:hypothetical protein